MTPALMGFVGLALALPCVAQALVDPTRPPTAAVLPIEVPGAPDVPGVPAPRSAAPVLQSILLSPNRRLAWIDGKSVQVGDSVGDARVIAIEVDSVKLRGSTGAVVVMKLVPDVQISKPNAGFASAEPRSRSRGEAR